MKVSVLIPAYNEANCIEKTVVAVRSSGKVNQIIVVDDGSTDLTSENARKAGAQVLTLQENRGKGAALNQGAKLIEGDIICLLDGDLRESGEEIEKLLEPIQAGRAHITVGKFPQRKTKAGFGLVKGLARLGIRIYTGKVMIEPLSGQRAFTKEAFKEILPFADGYGVEVLITIKALRKNFILEEVDTNMSHNYTGRSFSGFLHRGRQFCHVAQALLKARRSLI